MSTSPSPGSGLTTRRSPRSRPSRTARGRPPPSRELAPPPPPRAAAEEEEEEVRRLAPTESSLPPPKRPPAQMMRRRGGGGPEESPASPVPPADEGRQPPSPPPGGALATTLESALCSLVNLSELCGTMSGVPRPEASSASGQTMEANNQLSNHANTTAKIPKRQLLLLCFVGVATMSYIYQPGSYLADQKIPHEPSRTILNRWTKNAYKLASELSELPSRASLPSPDHPFIFFHIRKAGGSSMRTILFKSSLMHGLDHWIPCKGEILCTPSGSPPYDQMHLRKAVYAGHINWSHMAQLMREMNWKDYWQTTNQTFETNGDDHGKERTDVYQSLRDNDRQHSFGSCLTNIRPTLSRVESCWNFRFVKEKIKSWNLPVASNMTVEEWKTLLPDTIDQYGNGCNNEMYRIFGSTQHETFVNRLSVKTYGATHYLDELETVLGRMAKCVMIRVDRCADSNTVLQHFFPWIDVGDLCQIREKQTNLTTAITDEAKEAILAQNTFDDMVFKFGAELFEAQLEVAKKGR